MRLAKIFWMSFRQLKIKRGFGLSFMTLMSVLGISVGVAALIIVISVMSGFEDNLIHGMTQGRPHIEITHPDERVGISLQDPEISDVIQKNKWIGRSEPFIRIDAVIKHRKSVQGAILYGLSKASTEQSAWNFPTSVFEGDAAKVFSKSLSRFSDVPLPGIVVGERLAGYLGVAVGDEVTVLDPKIVVHNLQRTEGLRRFVVVGVFSTGETEFDTKSAFTDLKSARFFMEDYDPRLQELEFVSGLGLTVKDPLKVAQIKRSINKQLESVRIETWQEANTSMLFALRLEQYVMGSILMLIVVVAAFSVSATLMMTIFYRRGQISLLKAMGMQRTDVLKVFLCQGLVIGILGIGIGLAVGLAACEWIGSSKTFYLPGGFHYNQVLPIKFVPVAYGIICLSAFVLVCIASVFPSRIAAAQEAVAGLKTN